MQDLNDLYYFAKVVDYGGFAPAGRALGEPKSKLSRRIALLEERLGVRLIQRSTRHFSVTEIGQTFHAHCRAMLVEAEAAAESIEMTRSQPRGIVRVSCPTMLLDFRVAKMVADFMAQCPDVQVHLEATNRRVDVIAEGFDLAIRVRPPPLEDSELVLKVLAERTQCLVAAPSLVERHGMAHGPADLHLLPSVALGVPQAEHAWRLIGPDGAEAVVAHAPRLVTRGMTALREAAWAGVGVAQLPSMIVRESVEQGRLLRVAPDWAPPKEIVHAVFPSRRGLLPSVREFIDFLAARFAELDES
ncbi:LysR family transcriptional regulator [Stenotrophomonas sp. MH1]|uniref:LysR family transcriptional regulator n=1 Tax=Stenotrophomonas capsici TaxID=3110230 RepID=A0ABU5V3K8_9GAMM|nr:MULTISPECIES: LysR family transcriptional regulator [unclassified Stenotrophomonas]MBD9537530.1 LysR family transcriptional regulator [Stenotrophomonas sp. STM01]MEA5667906.1 LysR family transcriptional regulator [Stenotrophomonas sp. MH1]